MCPEEHLQITTVKEPLPIVSTLVWLVSCGTGGKPYKCEQYGKAFSQTSNGKLQLRMNKGGKGIQSVSTLERVFH